MTLQDCFYALGIVYMSIMLLLTIAIVAVVFTMKAKLDAIERHIAERIHAIGDAVEYGQEILGKAQSIFHRKKS